MKKFQTSIEHFFPCDFERGGPVLVVLGVLSALFYVYTSIWYDGRFHALPQNLMIVTFLISAWGQRHRLMSDLMFKFLILAFVIPWLLFGINAVSDYETAVKYRSTDDLLKLMLFLPLAWWTGGSAHGARWMLAIGFLGLITAIVLDPNLMTSLDELWAGRRIDFDISNAQHGALFFGVVLIFSLCGFSLRLQDEIVAPRVKILLFVAALTGMAGLIGTQTRAAFLGLLVCGFVAMLAAFRKRTHFAQDRASTARRLLALVLLTGVLFWPVKELLHDRIAKERETIQVLQTGNLEELPFTSIGMRIASWDEALKWIAQKPVIGWGRKARSDVIKQSDRFPEKIKSQFGHLHNGYLEILIGLGAVGFCYVCLLWALVLSRIKLAASRDLYAFALYSSVFFFTMNIFESFFVKFSGEFAVSLFLSAGYSQYLARSLAPARPVDCLDEANVQQPC